MKNFPGHFHDPDFRKDMQRTIEQSVEKIVHMTKRLSPLSVQAETNKVLVDINDVVAGALDGLKGSFQVQLIQNLHPVAKVSMDPEGIRTVVTNLLMNAIEATNRKDRIFISTGTQRDWVTITVRDEGPGMSREFITRSLFQPFQTTKKQG